MFGGQLEWVTAYKYLGIVFDAQHGFGEGISGAQARARASLGRLDGLLRTYPELRASADLQMRLFDTIVRPSGDYGSPVWCLPHMDCTAPPSDSPEGVHLHFLRRLLFVPTCTPIPALYRETDRHQWQERWGRAAVRFWNKQRDAPRTLSTLTPWVLEANHQLWRGGDPHCWSADFLSFLYPLPDPSLRERFRRGLGRLNEAYLLTAQRAAFHRTFWTRQDPEHPDNPSRRIPLADPRTAENPHRCFATYLHWFWPSDSLRVARADRKGRPRWSTYLTSPTTPLPLARRVAAFCLGHPALGVHQGRLVRPNKLPFAARRCTRCAQDKVDDALHLLFECDGAGLATARARHQPLLSQLPPFATQPAAAALALANTTLQHSMALFVADCASCLPKPPSHHTRCTVRGAAARAAAARRASSDSDARARSASTGSDDPSETESYSEYSELVDDDYY